ncbi:MAG TPA: dihydrolipoamide acetyltransferase family protein [Sphingomonadaceae bacterium]|nr:dihydrolipoamide acetyltransferase family protein [Sphingomonadaceae bacterium]
MARVEFKLPDIGEGIAEAEIVAWHVQVGDMVAEDQQLADMMTDKATVEMESPVAGRVVEVAGAVGDQIAIGSVLVVFETEAASEQGASPDRVSADPDVKPGDLTGEMPMGDGLTEVTPALAAADPSAALADDKRSAADRRAEEDRRAVARPQADRREGPRRAAETPPEAVRAPRAVLASPAVRQRAKDLGIDLGAIRPAGGDRVRHGDLDAYLMYSQGAGAPFSARGAAARPDEQVKVVGLRRRIAENMQEAKRRIPHFMYADEIDVTALEAMRASMNAVRGSRPKLTVLPFLITAYCRAIPSFPMVNATYDDDAGVVTRHGAVHFGIAAQTPQGLMVPVIRDAQAKDVWTLAAEIVRLAEAARTGKAARDELSGSTITLSSLGPMGGVVSTPVINRPEVAITAVNKVAERPVVIDGRIEVRKLMNLSSSFDHRVVDGWDAASFIQEVKRLFESPALLFA